ncbi:MAG: carbohydrate kinase family protein [archaeon]|jgi:ribokinase|nr:carbohydrate kinase family protein [archaeon]
MPDVIGFGNLNTDILYRVDSASYGREACILEQREEAGGSAANTLVGLSRLGFKTAALGVVGSDSAGKDIMEILKKESVKISGVSKKKGQTSKILAIIDKSGASTFYRDSGVAKELELSDINTEQIKKAKYFHMSSFVDSSKLDLQKALVKKLGKTKLSFSPGKVMSHFGYSELIPILKKTDILLINEEEIKYLMDESYEGACSRLFKLGVKRIAVTRGKEGSYVASRKESYNIPTYPANVVDSTGSGDAYAAGFLAGILAGRTLSESGKMGSKVASLCIQHMGAREGLPTMEKLLAKSVQEAIE